jgi:hypothetical protein
MTHSDAHPQAACPGASAAPSLLPSRGRMAPGRALTPGTTSSAQRAPPAPCHQRSRVLAVSARDRGGSGCRDRSPAWQCPPADAGAPVYARPGEEAPESGDAPGAGRGRRARGVSTNGGEPRLADAQTGQRAVLCMEAAHVVFAPCWGGGLVPWSTPRRDVHG